MVLFSYFPVLDFLVSATGERESTVPRSESGEQNDALLSSLNSLLPSRGYMYSLSAVCNKQFFFTLQLETHISRKVSELEILNSLRMLKTDVRRVFKILFILLTLYFSVK